MLEVIRFLVMTVFLCHPVFMTLCNTQHTASVHGPHAARVPLFGPRYSRMLPTAIVVGSLRNRVVCLQKNRN